MALSISYCLSVLAQIKSINRLIGDKETLDAFIFAKEKVRGEINDELDELFAAVELSKWNTDRKNEAELERKLNTISVMFSEEEQQAFDYDMLCDNVQAYVKNLHWYNAELLNLYIKHGNYRAIEQATGIPWSSCYKNISKTLRRIKIDINKKRFEP